MRLYHFTNRFHRAHIDVTESNLDLEVEHAGPDVVWLYDRPVPDATTKVIGTTDPRFDKHAVVITVDVPDAIKWTEWEPAQKANPLYRAAMVHSAGGIEFAKHWYVLPRRIPRSEWISIKGGSGRTGLGLRA